MPSLVDASQGDNEEGETATASDMAWIVNALPPADDDDCANDDSTLSASMIIAALEEIKSQQKQIKSPISALETGNKGENQGEDATNDTALNGAMSVASDKLKKSPQKQRVSTEASQHTSKKVQQNIYSTGESLADTQQTNHPQQTKRIPLKHWKQQKQIERIKGPNETLYMSRHSAYVDTQLIDFRRKCPDEFREYRKLNPTQQEYEQKRVMRLLSRLGISKHHNPIQEDDTDFPLGNDADQTADFSAFHDEQVDEDLSQDEASSMRLSMQQVPLEDRNMSVALLSPSNPEEDASMTRSMEVSEALLSPPLTVKARSNQSHSSVQSIEVARSGYVFKSPSPPTLRANKRLATSSGKRGADLARSRRDGYNSSFSRDSLQSPESMLQESMRRLSVAPSKVFTASQSPIMPLSDSSPFGHSHSKDDCSSDGFVQPDISLGDEHDGSNKPTLFRDSIEETTLKPHRSQLEDGESRNPFTGRPRHLGLRKGATFHLEPLQMERHRRNAPPTQSFPDPLDAYIGRMRERMGRVYRWIRGREDSPVAASIILSMSTNQIVDVTMKLLLRDPPMEHSHSETQSQAVVGKSAQGHTLIVVREKQNLDIWGQALREGSGYSLLDHTSLSVKERKSPATSKKCIKYGVVLTTFDCLKAADVTVSLDGGGCVQLGDDGIDDGWFSSRSNSQAPSTSSCKQLSVLHRIQWKRVVFVDEPGRKCYLAKPDTSRSTAARALSADSRIMFFADGDKREEQQSAIEALVNSHKNSFQSLASVLRLEEKGPVDPVLREVIIDFKGASSSRHREKRKTNRREAR